MNNVFSFKRFGNFFMYELSYIGSRFTHNMLAMGILPLIMAAFSVVLNLMQGDTLTYSSFESARSIYTLVLILIPIMYPARMYGRITDKKSGADWMLIPASGLEKFISVMLINVVVVPGILLLMLFACDKLLWLIFGDVYGTGWLSLMAELPFELILVAVLSFVNTSLTFLLGAICFRKAKVAKTILVLFALWVLISVVFTSLLSVEGVQMWAEKMAEGLDTTSFDTINVWVNIGVFVPMVLLAGAIYYRLKTIKY